LSAERYSSITIDDSPPFVVPVAEAPLLACCEGARRDAEQVLIIGHGGCAVEEPRSIARDDLVTRFRCYNLAHAEVLEHIVDPTTLTRERVAKIVEVMDRIVDDFAVLFASRCDECAILPEVYGALKRKILAEVASSTRSEVNAEAARLLQTFDDPASLGAAQTLHGLKRYLHQRGLEFGIQLGRGEQTADRTVDLVLASGSQPLRCVKKIRYADFEAGEAAGRERGTIPWPVRLAVEAYGRQLLNGQQKFPHLRILCYGNEVHYYLSFWNHPALVRVDFSPPLRGGMVDLSYYGVSNYDEAVHPNPSLDVIQLVLRRLDFDVHVDCTRIRARFDKEQTLDAARLYRRVEALLRLAPYLMDLDWTIGSLALDVRARRKVAEAWAESFGLWGVMPMERVLTKDRRNILVAIEQDACGEREVVWNGDEAYRDRFGPPPRADRFERAFASLERAGVDTLSRPDDGLRMGQIAVEDRLLLPLRQATAHGAVTLTADGTVCGTGRPLESEHEVERFARLLSLEPAALAECVRAARLLPTLAETVRFETTGSLNGYEVQRARLELRGRVLVACALLDSSGIVRLAFFVDGTLPDPRRAPTGAGPGVTRSATDVAALLFRANYLVPGSELSASVGRLEAARLRESFRRPNPRPRGGAALGRYVLHGRQAAPGRAAGPVVFGTSGRTPEQLDGAVLVAPTVLPEDNTFIYHCSGVVTTGGGILSHAGLLATQFGKPAMIVSARWQHEKSTTVLRYTVQEFQEEERCLEDSRICIRRARRENEHTLHEGDLVVVDADEGTLHVLGQDQTALALHDELARLAGVGRRRAETASDRKILLLRGERLRTERQISRLLERLTDPDVARYAVRELLLGPIPAVCGGEQAQRARLLSTALDNPHTGDDSRRCLLRAIDDLSRRRLAAEQEVLRRVPSSSSLFEILSLRLDALDALRSLDQGQAIVEGCGIDHSRPGAGVGGNLDDVVRTRLRDLREACASEIPASTNVDDDPRSRHLLRQLDRLDLVLGTSARGHHAFRRIRAGLEARDERVRRGTARRRVLPGAECGFESAAQVGWKAANLAEIERLCGEGLVPAWFAVTREALEGSLRLPVRGITLGGDVDPSTSGTLRGSIEAVLRREDWDPEEKSRRIRALWESVDLSAVLVDDVVTAYRRLIEDARAGPNEVDETQRGFVAIRSSSLEEDTEAAARAGEFETFLYVRGESSLLTHLKRAWSGLWTARAIHNRVALGSSETFPTGGIIVQRIVGARAAGVLQTVNVGQRTSNEIVVNAGLGLGEGVVGGVVLADQYTVAKEGDLGDGPLHYRCVTTEKTERVVFNRRLGTGTVRQSVPAGERLRPALERHELQQLVRASLALERAYGYPLDVEFAFEGSRLWILQARPLVAYRSTLRETLERWPLSETATADRHGRKKEVDHDPA
jgi:hypothetical protein